MSTTGAPARARTKYQRVMDLANPFESDDYGLASGHVWDRIQAVAMEYQRGDNTWARTVELVGECAEDARQDADAQRALAAVGGDRIDGD